jgi:hypothetical protein
MYSKKSNPFDLNATTLPAHEVPLLRRIPYFLAKALNFIRRYKGNLPYLFRYGGFVWQSSYREEVLFLSDADFIEEAKKRSTLRLQDGEFTLLLGTRDVSYEKKDDRLTSMWMKAIREYSDQSPYILGLPPYIIIDNKLLHKEGFKYLWMPAKILYRMWFSKRARYFNGSYFYINNTSVPFMQTLSEGKDVLLVSNSEVIGHVKPLENNFFKNANSISYVETPEKNAFASYEAILKEILNKLTQHTIVFMACGPAGKALIYDLSKKGILAHDIGYGLTGAYTGEEREHFLKWDVFGPLYYEKIKHD